MVRFYSASNLFLTGTSSEILFETPFFDYISDMHAYDSHDVYGNDENDDLVAECHVWEIILNQVYCRQLTQIQR